MIVLHIPAHMTCVEAGCEKSQPVRLFLNTMGCIQFQPSEPGWQVLAKPGEVAPFVCRCPEHKQRVTVEASLQAGPAGPRVKLVEH